MDGLPLAIELAAARTNVLGLAELSSLVERRLALLRDRPPSDPIRTALLGLVEWSYELLHTDEKTLLHQLAVHRGGASLSSLLAVAANDGLDEATVNHLLAALVDKSIISVSFPDEEARYDLLDTVRDYALERLAESGGLAAARKAHAEYFATLAEAARRGLRGAGVVELGQASRARQRQPLGRPRLRARHARPRRRDLAWRVAGLCTSRSPSASPRAASSSSSRSRLPRTTRRSACDRAAGVALLPRHGGARPRRRDRGGRTGACALRRHTGTSRVRPGAGDARARAQTSRRHQRAAKLAEEAREASEAGDHGTAAIVRVCGAMACGRRGRRFDRRRLDRRRRAARRGDRLSDQPARRDAGRGVGRRAAGRRESRGRRLQARARARKPTALRRPRRVRLGAAGLATRSRAETCSRPKSCSGGRSPRRMRHGHPG